MIARAGPSDPGVGAVRLRIPAALFREIQRDLQRPHAHADERIGFLSAATGRGQDGEWLLLAKSYEPLADERYVEDETVGARIDGHAIRGAMQRALDTGMGIFHVHMHPHRGVPRFSATDRGDQPRLVDSLASVAPAAPHGMLVLSEDRAHAWVRIPGMADMVVPALISIVGDPLVLTWLGAEAGEESERFSRQGFLGPDAQVALENARVGIIGMGGGGSHLVQQLLHVGVRHLRVFDHDRLDESNLNRTVGATAWDAEEQIRKVAIARRLAAAVLPDNRMVAIPGEWQQHPELLRGCDVVIGAVDTFAGRRDLEAVCRRFVIPLVDVGMDVHTLPGEPPRMGGQVIVSIPGARCMHCLGFLTDERLAREAANYGGAGGRPQVVWPNGVLASTAVGIVVDLLTGWSGVRDRIPFLSYDGNLGILGEHPRWPYIGHGPCPHYPAGQIGDPVFSRVGAEEMTIPGRR